MSAAVRDRGAGSASSLILDGDGRGRTRCGRPSSVIPQKAPRGRRACGHGGQSRPWPAWQPVRDCPRAEGNQRPDADDRRGARWLSSARPCPSGLVVRALRTRSRRLGVASHASARHLAMPQPRGKVAPTTSPSTRSVLGGSLGKRRQRGAIQTECAGDLVQVARAVDLPAKRGEIASPPSPGQSRISKIPA